MYGKERSGFALDCETFKSLIIHEETTKEITRVKKCRKLQ